MKRDQPEKCQQTNFLNMQMFVGQTLFKPAPVIALTHINRASTYATLCEGVEAPQKMALQIKDVAIK